MVWFDRNIYNKGSEEPWNANKVYLEQLMRRCDERDHFANERNYVQWYTSLRTIYSIIHWKYEKMINTSKKEDEKSYYANLKKELDRAFINAKAHLNNVNRNKDPIARNLSELAISKLQDELDNINFLINDFIVLSGIVNIDGDSRTWMEKLSKELDVENEDDKEDAEE